MVRAGLLVEVVSRRRFRSPVVTWRASDRDGAFLRAVRLAGVLSGEGAASRSDVVLGGLVEAAGLLGAVAGPDAPVASVWVRRGLSGGGGSLAVVAPGLVEIVEEVRVLVGDAVLTMRT